MTAASGSPGSEVDVDRPVFVIGTGRSGLSPLMDLIAYHPAFAWPSQYHARFPAKPRVSRLSRVVDLPLVRSGLKFRVRPYMPVHDESYPFWDHLFHGFSQPFRDLLASDVTPWVRERVRRALAEIVRYQGKTHFVAEYSGWSRVEFLKAIFPEARFIHIVRDGRAVANSLTHVAWWRGWQGVHRWRLGVPEPALLEALEKYEHSFLALAGIYWKILIRNLVEKTSGLSADEFRLVRYEDLVADPPATARACIALAGLDADLPRFRAHLRTVAIVDANSQTMRIPSWRRNMSHEQIAMLDDLLGEELALFDYL